MNYSRLFNFNPQTFGHSWGSIDDVVMGGNSMSAISCEKEAENEEYHVAFKGEISLRNGGFCGLKSRNATPAFDLSEF